MEDEKKWKINKMEDNHSGRLSFCRLPFWSSSILVVFIFFHLPFWSSSILVVFHFGRPPFWSSSILVVFHFGRLPLWSSSILVVFHFGRPPFWSSSILIFFHFCHLPFWSDICKKVLKFFLHHTLILRPALLYSQFTAMLVKSGSSNQTVDLVPMGACVNCTTTYSQLNALNVIKFIPSTSHLINTSLPPFVG